MHFLFGQEMHKNCVLEKRFHSDGLKRTQSLTTVPLVLLDFLDLYVCG